MPLESPHDSIHLAVGGFDVPKQKDYSPIKGANGDMGENDTAPLDPIFYFHHCFVAPNSWLTLESPHDPFMKTDGSAYTSRDCMNIETQLGYTYGPGSLEVPHSAAALTESGSKADRSSKIVRVAGINRAPSEDRS